MKLTDTITINEELSFPIKAAVIDNTGDLSLTVDRATKKGLSLLACFPVHTIEVVMEDFGYFLVLERRGARNGSMLHYEDNSMSFKLTDRTEADRIYRRVANA